MRPTVVLAASALVAAVVAVWGATAITANSPTTAVATAAPPIGVMQMMRDAKNLPEQQFDAI